MRTTLAAEDVIILLMFTLSVLFAMLVPLLFCCLNVRRSLVWSLLLLTLPALLWQGLDVPEVCAMRLHSFGLTLHPSPLHI